MTSSTTDLGAPRRLCLVSGYGDLVRALRAEGYETAFALEGWVDRQDMSPGSVLHHTQDSFTQMKTPQAVSARFRAAYATVMASTKDSFLRNMARQTFMLDGHGRLGFSETGHGYAEILAMMHNATCGYLSLLTELRIDGVVHCTPPHLGYDNVLDACAEALSIPRLTLVQSHFPEKFFFGLTAHDAYEKPYTSDEAFASCDEEKYEANTFYMKKDVREPVIETALRAPGRLFRAIRVPMGLEPEAAGRIIARAEREITSGSLIKGFMMAYLAPITRKERRQFSDMAHRRRIYEARLSSLAEISPDLDCTPFVYMPLHLQPEATTSEFAGDYLDQIRAAEELLIDLPDNWRIIIKENPKQGAFFRDPSFLDRIENNARLVLAAKAVDSAKLIDASAAVATIGGTAGYEAILAGKPCIVFGAAWYQRLPGVVRYYPGIDTTFLSKPAPVRSDIEEEVDALRHKLADGVVNHGWMKITSRNADTVATTTALSVIRLLNATDHPYDTSRMS